MKIQRVRRPPQDCSQFGDRDGAYLLEDIHNFLSGGRRQRRQLSDVANQLRAALFHARMLTHG
jgi:ABC-type hemin transport system ATPase subunit